MSAERARITIEIDEATLRRLMFFTAEGNAANPHTPKTVNQVATMLLREVLADEDVFTAGETVQ